MIGKLYAGVGVNNHYGQGAGLDLFCRELKIVTTAYQRNIDSPLKIQRDPASLGCAAPFIYPR